MNLVPLLTALGVRRANEADGIEIDLFEGGPAVERIYARQSTFIEVNESGTEARAMTAFLAEACDSVPMPPFEFIADRPFLYVLESMDGIPLFMGVVSDPTRQ